ncbi:MAG TPA: glutamate-1-semialdehyde-2,1-aminomutase [Coriobacteriia bacterium]|nr:glutamate-1-semialdehyde-2,1-aminomutase [Coriobacteriia bacterium]
MPIGHGARKESQRLFTEAQALIPGGVNSPVRAYRSVGETPVFYDRADGAYVWDVDGNKYTDFVGSWGPMILGHRPAAVMQAVADQLTRGTSYGAPCEAEVILAEKIVSLVPNIDMVRMVSSGTEATMSALRLARGYTKREKIIKFEGNYHGHSDALLVSAGSGVATLSIPGTPGVTEGTAKDTLVARYNDLDSVAALFAAHKDQIAAIIVEPIAGNMGLVPPLPGFLEGLRTLCDDNGTVLLFDEVISGFRASLGGAQELFGIQADLVTFGKIIGGGFPVGCFAGRADIMKCLAPSGPVYQAGTLSGNPIAMAAGIATLSELAKGDGAIYKRLDAKGALLKQGLKDAVSGSDIQACVQSLGSLATIFFTPGPVTDWQSASLSDTELFSRYFKLMLRRGFIIAPSQYECLFVSDAHTEEDIIAFTSAVKDVLCEL